MKMKNFIIVNFLLTLLIFGIVTDSQTQIIRCADPKCTICLAVPGAKSPEQTDTRESRNRPEDAPFGREPSLAAVNPVLRSPYQSVISLRGDWEFLIDPQAVGVKEEWIKSGANWNESRTMPVPGNWESNDVGEPGMSAP
jgi:hypothetical protein